MEFHPIANIFPLLQGQEYEELKTDIARNGLIEPIWLHPDGRIIDGRNRWRACVETGTNARLETYQGDLSIAALASFVISLNLHRRHLTSSQYATCAVKARELMEKLKSEAKDRQDQTKQLERNQHGELKPVPQIFEELVLEEPAKNGTGEAAQLAAELFNTNRQYIHDAETLAKDAPELFEKVSNGEMSIPKAKQVLARQRVPDPAVTPPLPPNKYRCIVLDPPWPMKKIEREERPNQGVELDYPVMSLEQIEALPVQDLADQDGCHLYLWVTQKFLPAGLELIKAWGFKYQCLLTWRKNVGITPYSWMYDTEHVIFARCGNLPLGQLGLRLSFDAPVKGHSVKPDIFYNERVIPASPGPRLDMFARKTRDGFEVWGNNVL